MNVDQKLAAIREVIQRDVGNRGLARDPDDNLLTRTRGDFANACASIASHADPTLEVVTEFLIPGDNEAVAETDGPLGAVFLTRAMVACGIWSVPMTGPYCVNAIHAGLWKEEIGLVCSRLPPLKTLTINWYEGQEVVLPSTSHLVALERPGPTQVDGKYRTMRGHDITEWMRPAHLLFERPTRKYITIGIGDGGNEIGMGKIPHETIVKNIPNGDLIHCRVPTDHLIVAGVSNWGAYALAAGVALFRGVELPAELFDPDREREILQIMVEKGPLVDGVTGKQTATVDGLSWEDYIQPLVEIGRILKS